MQHCWRVRDRYIQFHAMKASRPEDVISLRVTDGHDVRFASARCWVLEDAYVNLGCRFLPLLALLVS